MLRLCCGEVVVAPARSTYYGSPDCDPNVSQRTAAELPSFGACDSALRKRHRHGLGARLLLLGGVLGVC